MQETNQAIESEVIVEQPIETQSQPTEEIVNETEEVVSDEIADSEVPEPEGVDETEEKFPKKAERALERRNKKINKLRAEKAELEKELNDFRARPQQTEDKPIEGLQEPREDDFEDYAEYLVAKGEYNVKRENVAMEQEFKQRQAFESQQQWVSERAKYVDERAAKAVESIPELDGLYHENQDIIEGYQDSTKLGFLTVEKPEMAFYALATEGKLEELDSMNPVQLGYTLRDAEIRGEEMSKARPQSKAPAPIQPAKGTGTRSKTLDDMSPSELLAYLKKQK